MRIIDMPDLITLWRHNSTTGYWSVARSCTVGESSQWLDIFQKDEPQVMFKISQRRPRPCGNPSKG